MTEEEQNTDTDKLFVVYTRLAPGGSKVLQEGEYTVRIDRAAPPRQIGWYLAVTPTSGALVAIRWNGTQWTMRVPAESILTDPVITDRLIPYREVLALMEGLSAAETRLERKYNT